MEQLDQHIEPQTGPEPPSGVESSAEIPAAEPNQEPQTGPERPSGQHPSAEMSPAEPDPEPTRPEGSYSRSPGWSANQSMEAQFAAAIAFDAWVNRGQEQDQAPEASATAEHDAAINELDQQIEGQEQGAEQNIEGVEPADRQLTQEFHDTAQEVLDHHIDNSGPSDGPGPSGGADLAPEPDFDRDL